jgi:hypothetical protein
MSTRVLQAPRSNAYGYPIADILDLHDEEKNRKKKRLEDKKRRKRDDYEEDEE